MIGRNAEIAELSRLIAESRAGQGNAVAVYGEAGIGKSALLAEAANGGSSLVLRAAGVEAESELPYAALHLLLRPARHLIAGLPPGQRAALHGAFGEGPGQASGHDGAPGRTGEYGAPDRFLVGLAVLTLLADLAEERPLLCLIDDVHWLDRASLDALTFAARRLAAEPITMIFAGRDGAEPAINGVPELRLSGLARTDCERLLAGRAAGLTPEARDRVIEEAEGNPLALLHFAEILTPEQRAGHLAPLPLRPPGPSMAGRLEHSLRATVRQLPERTRLLLLVAAADGSGSLHLVLRAAQAFGAGPEDLEPAEQAALVDVSGDRVRFRHPLVKAAAYHEAPLTRRTAAHRALAGVLDGHEHADRRAWHLSAAALEPDEEISAVLAAAGERAGERGSNASAATAYERAAQLTVDRERRAGWLAAAAESALGAGQLPRAAATADRGRRLTADPLLLARLASVRAAVEAEGDDPAPAAYTLIAAAADIVRAAPADAASLLATAASEAWFAGDRGALGRAADLLESFAPQVDARLTGVVAAVRGMERVAAGDPAAGLPLLRAALHSTETGLGHATPLMTGPGGGAIDRVAGTYAVFGALMTGDDDAACELAAARVAACRRHGLVGALPHALQLLTQAQILRGRHAEAAASGAEAWQIARDTGQEGRLRHLHGVLARLAAIRGEDDECRRLAAQAEGSSRERNGSGWGGCALTLLDLVRARYDAAAERMAGILDGPLGHTVIVTFALADHVEACARLNQVDRATAALARFDAWAEAGGRPWAAAVAHRCRALLAPREEAEAHYVAALAVDPQAGRPFEQARTRLLYGEWLRRARRRADAGTQLRAALESFVELGAVPWAERARTELAAAGVHAAEPGPPAAGAALSTLTPQELQVVRLAATGATNRQIGAQLFLSPRTVGFHLYKAYPKLGISSRAELTDLELGPPV
ncbi:regulatory protein, luxR family [Nonomuraea solani]|uniref:Regulatory protein, luxR family n=1 Tax=Nonomuraea solani TaxID=1144553 RepID=A0A1H6F109_9ACTN|nr:LuxR family transcriptional regulator [Nonomuraea solani]SEH03051.1 regulatory protein, luxR family [Nonomuraea solani]